MTQLKMTMAIAVAGGPTWSINRTEDVEAYDVVSVAIPAGASDTEVQVQPGESAQIIVLAIQSSVYGDDITYKASDGTTDSDALTLHGPQLFGRGVTSLFGLDVKTLKFSNALADGTATIQVLVGRDATA
jgi:hypothetical protein